jgi:hypothetical protein
MAWAGKASSRQKTMLSYKSRQHPRRLSLPDLAPGGIVPRSVMRQLQWRQLPFDKRAYEQGLQELLAAYELSGG